MQTYFVTMNKKHKTQFNTSLRNKSILFFLKSYRFQTFQLSCTVISLLDGEVHVPVRDVIFFNDIGCIHLAIMMINKLCQKLSTFWKSLIHALIFNNDVMRYYCNV